MQRADSSYLRLMLTIILIKIKLFAMIVCICKAISDRHIRRLAGEGASSLRELSRGTGLGTCCGKCVPQAREVLSEALCAQPIKLADLSGLGGAMGLGGAAA